MVEQFDPRLGAKRPATGQQLVENNAQTEYVAAAINPMALAARLFRAHVTGCAGKCRSTADVFLAKRQSEIGDVRLAGCIEENVSGLDVAVDQALAMGIVQRLRDSRDQFRRLRNRKRSVVNPFRERLALNELRHNVAGKLFGAADIVNRNNIGMVQTRDGARFRKVGFSVLGIQNELAMGNLDCDRPLQSIVTSEIDNAKPSVAQFVLNQVAANGRGPGSHGLVGNGRLKRAGPVVLAQRRAHR